jgi:hypothetical protein
MLVHIVNSVIEIGSIQVLVWECDKPGGPVIREIDKNFAGSCRLEYFAIASSYLTLVSL